jgi:hypothetical protein
VTDPGIWFGVRVIAFAATVPLLLWRPVDRWGRHLTVTVRASPPSEDSVNRLVTAIDRALRAGWPLVRTGCLTRGITMYRFLTRAGVPVSLHLGAGLVDNRFAAHCWVERHGQPVREPHDPRTIFTSMHVITPDSAAGAA